MTAMPLKERIKYLPLTSGVYLMKDAKDKIIYVGKAVSLRKRVQSYFRKTRHDNKTDLLLKDVDHIDTIQTQSEAEALILEANLIKTYRPKYNIEKKDDKTYPYILITGETYPRIDVVRPNSKGCPSKAELEQRGDVLYGPYTKVTLIREALAIMRRIFHFRTCHPFPDKECLDYHIGLCEAPCIDKIGKRDYRKNIRHIRLILEGKKDELYRGLQKDMEHLASEHKYEAAAKVRDQMRAIGALYSGTQDVNYYKEAEQLQRALNLPRMPERIECFDISNTMGQQAVGSMVSFFNGKPDKSQYRRFRIKTVEGIDDFEMIGEVVQRRYRRLRDEGKTYPDLILIDGGKGQLSSAVAQLKGLGTDIPIASLAKREEEVYVPGRRTPVRLSRDSLGLKLLQRTRDEAHRFALAYHRNLRDKNIFGETSAARKRRRKKH